MNILWQGLALVLFGLACEATSLGMTVLAEPLESDGGNMVGKDFSLPRAQVRAFFTAIVQGECPSFSSICTDTDVDCMVYTTSTPFEGTKPDSAWCVRQWQKTVSSVHQETVQFGSDTSIIVSMKTGPTFRGNSGRLNYPPNAGLYPPLRAREGCPHHFRLSVRDPDGDKVRCRFADQDQEECEDCTPPSYIELDEENCMFVYNGKAPVGQYFIYLMVEDYFPVPLTDGSTSNGPLSAIPLHLSLSVEQSNTPCSAEPLVQGDTPNENIRLFVLPYHDVEFSVDFVSQTESVSEIAVVGPPGLFRVYPNLPSSKAQMDMAWVRKENMLPRMMPVCYAANTDSTQSEPRCVWVYQREVRTLPDGTELTCDNTKMVLVLPISTLTGISLTDLQLNSGIDSSDCEISNNGTHLTASISLSGCGTKTVQAEAELVFVNTLQSKPANTRIIRKPIFILPLACRIPGIDTNGPFYNISIPSRQEDVDIIFGDNPVQIQVFNQGSTQFISNTRSLRDSSNGQRDSGTNDGNGRTAIDLHVTSSSQLERAEIVVRSCNVSKDENFTEVENILDGGCTNSERISEISIGNSSTRIYRIQFSTGDNQPTTSYIRCIVNLCVTTLPGSTCPDLCTANPNLRMEPQSVMTSSDITVTTELRIINNSTTTTAATGTSTSTASGTTSLTASGTTASAASGTTASTASGTTASTASGTTASTMSGTTASTASGTTASTASGTTSSTASGTTASTISSTTASTVSGTTASTVSGTTASTVSGTTASTVSGTTASTVSGTTASTVSGTTASTISGTTASTVSGTTASTISGTTASTVSGTTASTVSGTTASTVSGTTASTVSGTTASTVSGTTTSTVSGTTASTMSGTTASTVSGTTASTVSGTTASTVSGTTPSTASGTTASTASLTTASTASSTSASTASGAPATSGANVASMATTQISATAHAPEQASTVAAGVILATISIFLQNVSIY